MDAHDKGEVQRSGQTNIIEIGNAGISSVKFGLSDSEKEQLFKNGYFAASKFILREFISWSFDFAYFPLLTSMTVIASVVSIII